MRSAALLVPVGGIGAPEVAVHGEAPGSAASAGAPCLGGIVQPVAAAETRSLGRSGDEAPSPARQGQRSGSSEDATLHLRFAEHLVFLSRACAIPDRLMK